MYDRVNKNLYSYELKANTFLFCSSNQLVNISQAQGSLVPLNFYEKTILTTLVDESWRLGV